MGYEERGFALHNFSRLDSPSFRPDLIHQEVHPILASRETTGHLGHTGIRYIQVNTGQTNTCTRCQPEVSFGLSLNIYLHTFIGKPDNTKMDENKGWIKVDFGRVKVGFVLKTFGFQMMQLNALFLVLISVTIPMALRASFGPLPFYVAFVATEAFKVIIILNQIKMINFLSR